MITFKINSRIKIQEYMKSGIKIFVKIKDDKWINIKFNSNEIELLYFLLNSIKENKKNN